MAAAKPAPPDDAPVGKQVDFVAARLGQVCKAHGFKRTGRRFNRVFVEGGATVAAQCFNLQGSQWNQGSSGRFCINLGLWWEPLERLRRELGLWRAAVTPPEAQLPHDAVVQFRVDAVVPAQPEAWWPVALTPGQDSWFEVGPGHQLTALADALGLLFERVVLPWLAARVSLEAVLLERLPGLTPDQGVTLQTMALVTQGKVEAAREAWAQCKRPRPEVTAWLAQQSGA